MSVMLVPAGMECFTQMSRNFFLKDEKNESEHSIIAPDVKDFFLPDRHIRYTSINYGDTPVIDEDYHLMAPTLGPAFLKEIGIKMGLINHALKKIYMNPLKDCGIITILDSGGFQLFSGKKEFIDPVDVVNEYNKFADIGMDLDIPLQLTDDIDSLKAIALVQKANYEVMRKRLKKGVSIALVSHGITIDEREIFYDILDRYNAKYVSIAGLARQQETTYGELYSAEAIAQAISLFPNLVYLHCLGATGMDDFIVYSLFYHLGLVKNIGADSTVFAYRGAVGEYETLPSRLMTISKNRYIHHDLSCSCPVCALTHDSRVINSFIPLASHSLFVRKKRLDMCVNIVKRYLEGKVTAHELLEMCASRMGVMRFNNLVRYIKEFKQTKRFKKANYPTIKYSKALFYSDYDDGDSEDMDDFTKRWLTIMRAYEEYHKKRFY